MGPRYFPSLDGLRGIAALLVVISHYTLDIRMFREEPGEAGPEYIMGAFGVMIFFALSGFLIMHVTDRLEFNRLNIQQYFVNRFARVIPLYWFILVFTCVYQEVLSGVFQVPQEYLAFSNFQNAISSFLQHFFLIGGDSIYWTISVEIIFYVMFPVLWVLARDKDISLVLLLALLALIALQVATALVYDGTPTHTRLVSSFQFFVLGALIYKLKGSQTPLSPKFHLFVSIIVLTAIAFLFPDIRSLIFGSTIWSSSRGEVWSTDFYFLVVVGVILVATIKYEIFQRILNQKMIRYLGKISFSIYLTHRFIVTISIPMGLADYSLFAQIVAFILIFFPVIIIVSNLTYTYIERPTQRWIRQEFGRSNG